MAGDSSGWGWIVACYYPGNFRSVVLGNPTGFYLTGGQASDLVGADHLLVDLEVEALLADKAYDADERVLDVLEACGAIAVIPPKRNRLVQRAYE